MVTRAAKVTQNDDIGNGNLSVAEATSIPDGWKVSTIGQEVEFTRKSTVAHDDGRLQIPFIPMELLPTGPLYTEHHEMRNRDELTSGVVFREGDILLAKITPCLENGKQGIVRGIPGGWGMASTEVFPIRPRQLSTEFLAFFLKDGDVRRLLAAKMQGATGRQRLPREALQAFGIPVPPPNEQQAIAHVLRTLQRAKETTDKTIAATRQLKQSLMRHLLMYGPVRVDEADKVELKETEIGMVPSHWKMIRLGDNARIGNGSTPKRTNNGYWENGTIPWLTSAKVYDRVIQQADEFVTNVAREECHLPLVRKGSVVVAITGQGKTLGNAAVLGLDCCVSQHLAYIQPTTNDVVSEFLLAFLHQRYHHFRQVSNAGGSTKGALTCGFLKGYPLALPPYEEQQHIAKAVGFIERKIEVEVTRQRALEALFKSSLHHLMTGKVRVTNLDFHPHLEVAPCQ